MVVKVMSAGFNAGDYAYILINGKRVNVENNSESN